ncbi:MAG: hypothetical protein FJZ00_14860 [Candidatus Sericytochromatia bacterium]|uniref:Toxin-antitoxin system protein n=1 Tax=Candidatus Tanganyikabacteria bacterium TaxID=2961651 RepID=A0A937X6U4_9BACT|nr:hypothetical protein [Candidatus Tanganyikabacteria bacterium]
MSDRSAETLAFISTLTAASKQAIVEDALEHYRRKLIMESVLDAYCALEQDPTEWQSLRAEFEELEGPIADGIG